MATEKRLIDVTDDNIKAILEKVPYYPDEIWKFTAMTKRFPTVDAVEVVRCKDCKNRDDITGECKHPKAVGWDVIIPEDNDFCSYGERKDNG